MTKFVTLKDIAMINPGNDGITERKDGLVSFLPMAAVSESGNILYEEDRIYQEVSKGYTSFAKGDILLAKITPCMENGKAAFICNLKHELGFGSTEFHVLRPTEAVDGGYLFYMVWNSFFRKIAEANMTGSAGQKRVPVRFLEDFKIPLPNLDVQRRIADNLNEARNLIDKRKQQIDLLDEFLQSVFLDMFGDPEQNSVELPVEQLGNHVSLITSGSTPKGGSKTYIKHGIPLIRSQNVLMHELAMEDVAFIPYEIHEQMKRSQVKNNDVLLNITGASIGRVAVYRGEDGQANVNQHVCIIRMSEAIFPDYLSHFISMPFFQERIKTLNSGATRQALNYTQIKNFDIPIPPQEKQLQFKKIVQYIENQKKQMNGALAEMQNLFNSIMQRAFKGEPLS